MNLSKRELEAILSRGYVKIRGDQKAILDKIKDDKTAKYHNKPVVINGIYFQSQAEANRWMEIQLLIRNGIIRAAERQKRFALPGGIIYVVDHVLTLKNGAQEAEEVKGHWSRVSINKCKQFVTLYDIPLYIVKNGQRAEWEEAIGELREFYFPRKKRRQQCKTKL